jgi:hypothetical protein
VTVYTFWSAGVFSPIEEKFHALSGYIRKTQTFVKIDRSCYFEEVSFKVSCLVLCYLYTSLCVVLMHRTSLFS